VLTVLLYAEATRFKGSEWLPALAVEVPVAGKVVVPPSVVVPLMSSVDAGVVVLMPTIALAPVPDWKSTESPMLETVVHLGI
jgi:hypothetical protein